MTTRAEQYNTTMSTEGDHHHDSTTSTSTSTEVNWGIVLPQLYEDAFRAYPSRMILRQMYDWAQLTSLDVLRYAIEEAACAPAPSWRYALAILRDCNGLHVEVKPGQSLRIAVETARGFRDYQQQRRRKMIVTDDETRMPWEEI